MLILTTERLALRHLELTDSEFILELVNQPAWLRHIGDKGVRSLQDASDYLKNGPLASYEEFGFGLFLVEYKLQEVPVGICGLIKRPELDDVDLGFAFLESFWGQGFATEVGEATIRYAQEVHQLKRLAALTSPQNEASKRVLQKLGFRFMKLLTSDRQPKPTHFFLLELEPADS